MCGVSIYKKPLNLDIYSFNHNTLSKDAFFKLNRNQGLLSVDFTVFGLVDLGESGGIQELHYQKLNYSCVESVGLS